MTSHVECRAHGQSRATYVCKHILDQLQSGIPAGCNPITDAEGELQAFCDACWNCPDEEWEASASDLIRLICLECLKGAARLNENEAELLALTAD